MKKATIAIDIDDTLFDHFSELAKWYNNKYGTQLTLSDNHPKGNDALKRWGATSIEQAVRRVHEFFQTKEYRNTHPYDGALEVLPELAQKYNLVVVTARDTIVEKFTHEWLEQHFKNLYSEVHFTAQYSLEGKSRTKIEVCRAINAEVLIDDSLSNCLEMAKDGRVGLVFGQYPWNEALQPTPHLIRVHDWYDVRDYFNAT